MQPCVKNDYTNKQEVTGFSTKLRTLKEMRNNLAQLLSVLLGMELLGNLFVWYNRHHR